jgi:hypothetical protein
MQRREPERVLAAVPEPLPPPEHLQDAGRDLWVGLAAEYRFDTPELRHVLRLSCEAADRTEQARREVERRGVLLPGREPGSLKLNLACTAERDNRAACARLLEQLHLGEPVGGSASDVGRAAAMARWHGGRWR